MAIGDQEYEDKKRYLKRYKKNLAMIDRLERKRKILDDKLIGLRSPVLSDMPKGGIPISNEDILADKLEIEERIARLKKKSKRLKSETLEIIDDLDDPRYAEVAESFFIDCMSLEDIADDMGYSTRHIERIYSETIDKIVI